ncbi:hypothetical protein [Cellulosimicrobium funkei]|uniref:hypothetical protein n=1 Tax=Cellulosimicrobium funkei TaxID=264251 RepID=UPI00368E6F12
MTPHLEWDSFVPLRASARWIEKAEPDEWETRAWVNANKDGSDRRVFVSGRLRFSESKHETTVQLAVVSDTLGEEWGEEVSEEALRDLEVRVQPILYSRARASSIAAAALLEVGISPPHFESAAFVKAN